MGRLDTSFGFKYCDVLYSIVEIVYRTCKSYYQIRKRNDGLSDAWHISLTSFAKISPAYFLWCRL